MRKFALILVATAAAFAAAAGPAAAGVAPAAALPVLTRGALAGPPVNPGDQLTSSLTPGTTLTLTTAPSGPIGLFCLQSSWVGKVAANPPVPGPAVIQVVAPFTIAACTDNNPNVVSVTGVAVNNLPETLQVNGAGTFPIQLLPAGAPLQIVVSLIATGGAPLTCVYQAVGVINGNTSLGSAPWRFTNQQFNLIAGPLGPCGTAPVTFFTASYSPVTDTTTGGANVFVN